MIGESDSAGVFKKEYMWLGDTPIAVVAPPAPSGPQCSPTPVVDTSGSFAANASLERLEVRSGKLGAADWEWGLGPNTQQGTGMVTGHTNWISGRGYSWSLTYNANGTGSFEIKDGGTVVATRTWTDTTRPLRSGNALEFYIKATAGIGAGNRIAMTVSAVDGTPVAASLQTTGDNTYSEGRVVFQGTSLQDGFTATGTLTMTFVGSYPPTGSRLNGTIRAGNVTCPTAGGGATTEQVYYVHADHLNTPRMITNETQQAVWKWDNLEPFGDHAANDNPSGLRSFGFNLRFPGQYFDGETQTHYNYYRDYDPSTGRFVQSDPAGLIDGVNTYSYVGSDPTGWIDSDGAARRRGGSSSKPPAPPSKTDPTPAPSREMSQPDKSRQVGVYRAGGLQ